MPSSSSSSFKVDRPLGDFLTLAPTVSASYPTKEQAESPVSTALSSPDPAASAGNAFGRRRSSTTSSSSSQPQSLRFLKLAPVHYGQHVGQENVDFHEVATKE